ncbi:MAG: non-heme iron oxygenase ferredoxin subunit [Anaerolineales bacterium]
MYNYNIADPEKCEFVSVLSEQDLPNGERVFIEVDNIPIVIFNIAGKFYAIGDLCSHDDGPLGEGELEGYKIYCPRHGASFDIRDGRVLSLPAIVDIPAYPVKVEAGEISVGIPIDE